MPSQLNQNQVLNYLADLPSLLRQAQVFLDLKNRQGKEVDFKEIDQILRLYLLNLIPDLEEVESLPYEEVFERLKWLEWLFEQEELIGGGKVPLNLSELEEELSRKEEKEAQETAKQKRLAQEAAKLARDLANRKKLLKALKEAQIQPEVQTAPDWQTIIKSLPENEELANFIQKTIANPEFSVQEKGAACQEAWERFLDQQEMSADASAAAKRSLSLETFGVMAAQLKQPSDQRTTLIETLEATSEPLTGAQLAEIQKDLSSRLVAYAPLAKDLGWEALAKIVAREAQKELSAVPLEQINRVARELAKTAESALPADTFIFEGSVLAPPVIIVNDKVFPFVGSPEIPGNPKGNHWKTPGVGDQALSFYLTTIGISEDELKKLAEIQKRVSGDPQSPISLSLSKLAAELGKFQAQYFSQEAIAWQANRVKAIFNASQVLTPLAKISLQAKNWFFQTGLGQSVKFWMAQSAQRNLQTLFNQRVAQLPEMSILTSMLKQSLGVLGTISQSTPRQGLKGALSVFGGLILSPALNSFSNASQEFLFSITAPSSPGSSKNGIKIALGIVAFILLIILGIGDAFLGEGKGGFAGPGGQPIEGIPPECNPTRHFGEEVICRLTEDNYPCDQERVNLTTWPKVNECFAKINLSNGQQEVVRQAFYNSVSNYLSLQCVGFVAGIQAALGRSLDKFLPHNSACDYLSSPPPQNYRLLKKGESVEVGDLAIWNGSACGTNNGFTYGHIAIVIAKGNNVRITIAEAIGDDKGVRGDLLIREVANDGAPQSPGGFLRYFP